MIVIQLATLFNFFCHVQICEGKFHIFSQRIKNTENFEIHTFLDLQR